VVRYLSLPSRKYGGVGTILSFYVVGSLPVHVCRFEKFEGAIFIDIFVAPASVFRMKTPLFKDKLYYELRK
jgi:hypothetical protein